VRIRSPARELQIPLPPLPDAPFRNHHKQLPEVTHVGTCHSERSVPTPLFSGIASPRFPSRDAQSKSGFGTPVGSTGPQKPGNPSSRFERSRRWQRPRFQRLAHSFAPKACTIPRNFNPINRFRTLWQIPGVWGVSLDNFSHAQTIVGSVLGHNRVTDCVPDGLRPEQEVTGEGGCHLVTQAYRLSWRARGRRCMLQFGRD
jgi:hypothetical protein